MISEVGRQHQAAHIPGREHGGGASSPGQRLRPPTLGSGSSDGRGREDLAGERLARTFGPFQDRRKTSLRLPSAISKNQEFS